MSLKLMYITNNPKIAVIAENAGVDRIFIDMEYIGKSARQGGMDTVQSHHTIEDIVAVRKVIKNSELLVRINPIHDKSREYSSSEEEIDGAINSGADILMLPFFKTKREVERFIKAVDGRVKTMLLLETPEAVEVFDEILSVKGIDEIHIGINDLSLGYKRKFMFELLADGTVAKLCKKISDKGIPYGFGGIARIGYGLLPAELVIGEHYKLKSSMAILSRSFCNANALTDYLEIEKLFKNGVKRIRQEEEKISKYSEKDFENNFKKICESVEKIVNS